MRRLSSGRHERADADPRRHRGGRRRGHRRRRVHRWARLGRPEREPDRRPQRLAAAGARPRPSRRRADEGPPAGGQPVRGPRARGGRPDLRPVQLAPRADRLGLRRLAERDRLPARRHGQPLPGQLARAAQPRARALLERRQRRSGAGVDGRLRGAARHAVVADGGPAAAPEHAARHPGLRAELCGARRPREDAGAAAGRSSPPPRGSRTSARGWPTGSRSSASAARCLPSGRTPRRHGSRPTTQSRSSPKRLPVSPARSRRGRSPASAR